MFNKLWKFGFIQLFAAGDEYAYLNPNKTTDTTATTGNDLSPSMKTYYDRELIEEAQAALIHDQFCDDKPIPKGAGKKIEFRKFDPLPKATTPLQEGITPTGRKLNMTKLEAEVNQFGDFVTVTDILDLTALDPIILNATKLLGRQAGLTLDTVTRDILNGGTSVMYCPRIVNGVETEVTQRSGLDTTSVLTVKMVKKAATMLKRRNAPTFSDGSYVALIHPDTAYELTEDPKWLAPHQYVDTSNIYNGEIGKIHGVRFVESSECKIFSGGVYSTIFLAQGAYGVTDIEGGGLETIVHQIGTSGANDPLNQRGTVGWKALKTAEILIPQYIIRVESKSPEFNDVATEN